MNTWLDVVIPARNPGSKFAETVDSLLAQSERGFRVVLSDNSSKSGLEHLAEAERRLKAAGVPVLRVKPPFELGRVQHWNWAHAAASSEWLKPLFVGDVLLPTYVQRVRERIEQRPRSALVRCDFEVRTPAEVSMTSAPFEELSLSPQQVLAWFPEHGNWLGGPINMAYRQSAWRAAGGYAVQLPACADLNLYVTIALHHGLESIREKLAAFQLHEQRFSHGIARRRVNGCLELWLILRQAENFCRNANLIWPEHGIRRGVWRQIKVDYWYPAKQRFKKSLAEKG